MSLVRVLRTAQVTLTHTFSVDEVPTDASGPVTATLKRLDGTTVATATAGHPGAPGVYTYVLPAQAQLDSLTLDWSGSLAGAAVSVRDYVEIVGGHLFDLGEARAAHTNLASTSTYPTQLLAARRIEVEQECEDICRQAFVPRFTRVELKGTGRPGLVLPHIRTRALRAVILAGTALDLATVNLSDSGVLTRGATWPWPAGQQVIVEVEHGMDHPPERIRQAAIMRLRTLIGMTKSGIPSRAVSFTVADGGVYRLSTPGPRTTGEPDIDAAYGRYTADLGAFA